MCCISDLDTVLKTREDELHSKLKKNEGVRGKREKRGFYVVVRE